MTPYEELLATGYQAVVQLGRRDPELIGHLTDELLRCARTFKPEKGVWMNFVRSCLFRERLTFYRMRTKRLILMGQTLPDCSYEAEDDIAHAVSGEDDPLPEDTLPVITDEPDVSRNIQLVQPLTEVEQTLFDHLKSGLTLKQAASKMDIHLSRVYQIKNQIREKAAVL